MPGAVGWAVRTSRHRGVEQEGRSGWGSDRGLPPPRGRAEGQGRLTFLTRFFLMLSTANTCSPIADSSMRGGGGGSPSRWRAGSGGACGGGSLPPAQRSHTPSPGHAAAQRSILEPAQHFPPAPSPPRAGGCGAPGAPPSRQREIRPPPHPARPPGAFWRWLKAWG